LKPKIMKKNINLLKGTKAVDRVRWDCSGGKFCLTDDMGIADV